MEITLTGLFISLVLNAVLITVIYLLCDYDREKIERRITEKIDKLKLELRESNQNCLAETLSQIESLKDDLYIKKDLTEIAYAIIPGKTSWPDEKGKE